MSFSIDQSLSLMIPRVFPQWTDEQKIIDVFHQQQLGRVYKVSVIRMPDSNKRGIPIYQAFVYFSAWYENTIVHNFQQRIFGAKKQARVVYDDPWYWVVFENKKRRLSNNDKRIMRIGYQTYVAEQYMLAQDERIRLLENILSDMPQRPVPAAPVPAAAPVSSEPHLIWPNISEEFAMNTLGDELNLTETAMNVAEYALQEEDVTPMDISFNISAEWTESGDGWQQTQLERTASEMLGEELRLTETATDVAEKVLDVDDYYWGSSVSFDRYYEKMYE
jgi:hypothetical protein